MCLIQHYTMKIVKVVTTEPHPFLTSVNGQPQGPAISPPERVLVSGDVDGNVAESVRKPWRKETLRPCC